MKYYGIGQDSDKDDKTFFGYTPFEGGGRLDFGVSRYFSVGGGVNYIDIKTDSGATGPPRARSLTDESASSNARCLKRCRR